MDQHFSFNKLLNNDEIVPIKKEWLNSLTSPQDGMWEHFRENGQIWKILLDKNIIGYASIDEDNQLLQFYVTSKYLPKGENIFKAFIIENKIQSGIVGTNNLVYLSMALNNVKTLKVHTCLFRNFHKVVIAEKEGILKVCQNEDLNRIVDFCHFSLGAPKEWLVSYIGELILKKEIFSFEKNNKIIGTCEVRRSTTSPNFADIGMVVSPDFRKLGYGTFLLHKAKTMALEWGKIPICSCEKNNIGSLKAIQNCGFVSMHQLLAVTFR